MMMMTMTMAMMMISFDLQCQANIKTYFLCMTESDQRVKILKNPDGTPRNFTVRQVHGGTVEARRLVRLWP